MLKRTPLATLNKPYLFLSTLVCGNNGEMIEVEGRLDHDVLRRALEVVIARHPVLNSRLEWNLFSVRRVEGEDLGPVDLRIERHGHLDDVELRERMIANIWDEPLPLLTGRPFRVHLIELPARSILQVITTHVWADARTVHRLCWDVAECYTALAEDHEPSREPIEVSSRDSEWLVQPAMPRSRTYYWGAAIRLLLGELITTAHGLKLPRKRGRNDFRKIELGSAFLTDLKAAAKARRTTVHGLITAAVARACRQHDLAHGRKPGRTHQLIDMFSLRPFAREDATHLADTMVVPFGTRVNTGDDDETVIRKTTAALERWKKGEIFGELFRQRLYALIALPSPKRLATALLTRFVVRGNVICTNPGPTPYEFDRLGSNRVSDFYGYSQLFPPGRIMCIFSTFRGRLRLCVLFDRNAFPEGVEAAFINPLLAQLDALIETSRPRAVEIAAE